MKVYPFNEEILQAALADLSPGGLRYYSTIGSTNDLALAWAAEGAPDFSLVVADEQTRGRGRDDTHWYSPAGTCLAFSLVLRPDIVKIPPTGFFTGLGALAVVEAIQKLDGNLPTKIKWPNDVLVRGQKCCGILTETAWLGEKLEYLVIGMGVNVHPGSEAFPGEHHFPSTCLAHETEAEIDRSSLLHDILASLVGWRARLGEESFIREWERHLAYTDQEIVVTTREGRSRYGVVKGLGEDGSLHLQDPSGKDFFIHSGSVLLRHNPV